MYICKKSLNDIEMNLFFKLFLASAITIVAIHDANAQKSKRNSKSSTPKNIILLIGDGMGTSQVYAGYTAKKGVMNTTGMPVTGFSITNSANNYITDSGAGGTALSAGVKTNNGSIGVDIDGKPVKTILEMAEDKGLSTGLVSTSAITHATPASFIAHTPNRSKYEDIAYDFLRTDIDVFIGGGYNHFARRADSLNLIDSLTARGYFIARDLKDVDVPSTQRLAALLADEHMPSMIKGRGEMLSEATDMAIKMLKRNKKGFFIMIEGSMIDWAAHDNDAESIVKETVDFDNAVGKALQFAVKNGETLVIVTADHETGGLGINGGNLETGEIVAAFTSKDHTATMVPVFAYGPGAERFTGVQQNTDIFKKCVELLGFTK
jgi:alkaline phosphatase